MFFAGLPGSDPNVLRHLVRKDELLTEVEPFCKEQVINERMTQTEADVFCRGLARPARPVGTEVDRGLIPAASMCVYPCFISTSDTPE